jgi:hypothetical protein
MDVAVAAAGRRHSSAREASSTGRGPNVLRETPRIQACLGDSEIPDRPALRLATPRLVNLITEPQKREPVTHPHLHSWVAKALQPNHQRVSRKRPARATHARRRAAGPRSLIAHHRAQEATFDGRGETPEISEPLSAASGCTRNSPEAVALVRLGSRADGASGAGGGRSLCANSTVGLQAVVSDSGAIPRQLHPQAEEHRPRSRSALSPWTRTSRLAGGARQPHRPENPEVSPRGGENRELERHQPTLTITAKAARPPRRCSTPAAP